MCQSTSSLISIATNVPQMNLHNYITLIVAIFWFSVDAQELPINERSKRSFASLYSISDVSPIALNDRVVAIEALIVLYEKHSTQLEKDIENYKKEIKEVSPPNEEEKIKKLQQAIDDKRATWQSKRDMLLEQRKELFKINAIAGKEFLLFPVRSKLQAQVFSELMYQNDGFSLLNSVAMQITGDRGSIFSELLSDNFEVVRFSVGTVIAASADTLVTEQALKRLMGGGGNTIVRLDYPLGFFNSERVTFLCQASPKLGLDFPIMGTRTDVTTYNFNGGIEVYASIGSNENKVQFFGHGRSSYVFGTDDYYDNLGVPRMPFFYSQLVLGITIFSNYKISVFIPVHSSEASLLKMPVSIGPQLIPAGGTIE